MGAPIVVEGLTKRYGGVLAVEDLTFSVRAGAVTAFLGPNGAGKTTTLRMLLGLAVPDAGRAYIHDRPYRGLTDPGQTVGAALEISSFHPGRTGRDHLRTIAAATGLPASRVDEVLRQVELAPAGQRRAKGYSLGMRQRLALATALLGDPEILVLDEPANGLDPQGIRWLRDLLRALAAEGRTILVSSHVLAEIAQTAQDVLVIKGGRLVDSGPIEKLTQRAAGGAIVRCADEAVLVARLEREGAQVERGDGWLRVAAMAPRRVGELALAEGVAIHELYEQRASLEDVFLELTGGEVDA